MKKNGQRQAVTILAGLLCGAALLLSGCDRGASAPATADSNAAAAPAAATPNPTAPAAPSVTPTTPPVAGSAGGGAAAAAARTPAAPATTPIPRVDDSKVPWAVSVKIGSARQEAERSPDDVMKIADLGALYYVHGLPEAAVQCFQRATEMYPNDPVWWYCLGCAYQRANQPAQAITALERSQANFKEDYPALHARLFQLYQETGQTAKAEAVQAQLHVPVGFALEDDDPLDKGTRRRGYDPDVIAEDALQLAQRGDPATAAEAVEEAEKIAPEAVKVRLVRALVTSMQGDIATAITNLRALVKDAPDFVPAKLWLGRLLARNGDSQEAEKLLREIVAAHPDDIDAIDGIAQIMVQQQKRDDVVRFLDGVLAQFPDSGPIYFRISEIYLRLGFPEKSETVLRRGLDLDPQMAQGQHALAAMLDQRGDVAEARERWQAALKANPQFKQAWLGLIGSYQRGGEWAAASAAAKAAVAELAGAADVHNAYAWILATAPDAQVRDPQIAVEQAELACRLTGARNMSALDTLAAAYASAGRFDEARSTMSQVVLHSQAALAQNPKNTGLQNELAGFKQRLELYVQGKPYISGQ